MEPFVVNKSIFKKTRLIDHDGNYHECIDLYVAQHIAKQQNLDLVCFSLASNGQLPLCKVINFSKWKYHSEKEYKKTKVHKKKDTKELRFSYVISEHDIGHKIKQANEFLDKGHEVLLTMRLSGRERRFVKEAIEKMVHISDMCKEHGKVVFNKEHDGQISIRLTK